jgi:hypothetical protein
MLYNLFYGDLQLRKLCVSNTETDTVVAKCCQVNSTICDKPFLEEMEKIATMEELEKPLVGLSFEASTARLKP